MKLVQVPTLNDYIDHRNSFIHAQDNDVVAFLDRNGKMLLLNSRVQAAVLQLFDRIKKLEQPWPPGEVIAKIEAPPRPVIPILAYVESVERLVKAIRV